LPHPGYTYVEKLKEEVPKRKIAYSPDLDCGVVQSDIAASVKALAEMFAQMGHEVEQIQGGPPDAGRTWSRTCAFFSAARLSHVFDTEKSSSSTGESWRVSIRLKNDIGLLATGGGRSAGGCELSVQHL
jgi:hypothetical protein